MILLVINLLEFREIVDIFLQLKTFGTYQDDFVHLHYFIC